MNYLTYNIINIIFNFILILVSKLTRNYPCQFGELSFIEKLIEKKWSPIWHATYILLISIKNKKFKLTNNFLYCSGIEI